jgi:hypothetical protein
VEAFLSHSSAYKKISEGLRAELRRQGLSVWSDNGNGTGDWQRRIEDAIQSASVILVLVGPRDGVDKDQQLTWMVALEAVWQDPGKRLVPILLKGAELPAFVYSGTSGKIQAVRVEDPRDLRSAAQAISEVLKGRQGGGKSDQDADPSSSQSRSKSAFSFSVDSDRGEERRARLSAIKQAVESLKL